MESDHRFIENRIEQYRALLAGTVDRSSYLTLARQLDAEIERLTASKVPEVENGHNPLRSLATARRR